MTTIIITCHFKQVKDFRDIMFIQRIHINYSTTRHGNPRSLYEMSINQKIYIEDWVFRCFNYKFTDIHERGHENSSHIISCK